MLRLLVIDEETRAKVAEIVSFAAKNWYRIGQSETIPGDDPRHTVSLNTYRCVFSYTLLDKDSLFRHLSVSVPGKAFPNPESFLTIAELFGFTGWAGLGHGPPDDWIINIQEEEHCIVAAQPVNL